MIELKELERQKREEIYNGITQLGVSYEEAKKAFVYLEDKCAIEITPPKREEPVLQMMNVQATYTGRFQGKSYKPGNIIFNMKTAVVDSLALGTSLAASIGAITMSQPVIAILTMLAAILSVAALSKIEVDDRAVLVLAVLWENRHKYGRFIEESVGFELVNNSLESQNREKLPEAQYKELLDNLQEIGCIELINGRIELKEKVHITY